MHLTAVAKACGFNREVIYQNPRCKALLAEAAANLGLTALETRTDVDSKPETAAHGVAAAITLQADTEFDRQWEAQGTPRVVRLI